MSCGKEVPAEHFRRLLVTQAGSGRMSQDPGMRGSLSVLNLRSDQSTTTQQDSITDTTDLILKTGRSLEFNPL
jgi:hypothetical protein